MYWGGVGHPPFRGTSEMYWGEGGPPRGNVLGRGGNSLLRKCIGEGGQPSHYELAEKNVNASENVFGGLPPRLNTLVEGGDVSGEPE